jgi:hypothetical protein
LWNITEHNFLFVCGFSVVRGKEKWGMKGGFDNRQRKQALILFGLALDGRQNHFKPPLFLLLIQGGEGLKANPLSPFSPGMLEKFPTYPIICHSGAPKGEPGISIPILYFPNLNPIQTSPLFLVLTEHL